MIKFKSKSFLYFIITTIKIYDWIFLNKFTIEILCVGDIKIHTRSKMTSMLSSDFDRQNLDLLLAIWTLMTSAETSKLSYNKLKTPWKLKFFKLNDQKLIITFYRDIPYNLSDTIKLQLSRSRRTIFENWLSL